MTDGPSPGELLRHGDDLWARLWTALAGRSDDELLRAGAAGEWTGKDVMVHLARWHDHGVEGIRALLDGREPVSYEDNYLEQNDRWHAQDRDIPAAGARSRCEASRRAIRDLLGGLDAEQWDENVRGWMQSTASGHYEEHLDALAAGARPD